MVGAQFIVTNSRDERVFKERLEMLAAGHK